MVVFESGSVGVKINKLRYYVVVCMYKSDGGSYGDGIIIYMYVQEWFGLLLLGACFCFFCACSVGFFRCWGDLLGCTDCFPRREFREWGYCIPEYPIVPISD